MVSMRVGDQLLPKLYVEGSIPFTRSNSNPPPRNDAKPLQRGAAVR